MMAGGWLMNNQKLSPIGLMKDDMTMSYMLLGQKSSLDLMQNCDLPPPLKVFSGPDKTVLSPTNSVWSVMEREHKEEEAVIEPKQQELGNDRFELLKALRRSQTRAREAERKYQALCKEKDALLNLLFDESARSLAYRNCIKVLELQILQLKTQEKQQKKHDVDRWHRTKEEEEKNVAKDVTWFMAVAFCLGIAGIGLAIGRRYLF